MAYSRLIDEPSLRARADDLGLSWESVSVMLPETPFYKWGDGTGTATTLTYSFVTGPTIELDEAYTNELDSSTGIGTAAAYEAQSLQPGYELQAFSVEEKAAVVDILAAWSYSTGTSSWRYLTWSRVTVTFVSSSSTSISGLTSRAFTMVSPVLPTTRARMFRATCLLTLSTVRRRFLRVRCRARDRTRAWFCAPPRWYESGWGRLPTV